MVLTSGCRFSIFGDLSHKLRSFDDCEHCVMPWYATVNDCTPRTKNEEDECNGTSDSGNNNDSQALMGLAGRRMRIRGIMGRRQTSRGCRNW